MFLTYLQNVCRIFAAYLICSLESCSPHIRRLLTQSIRCRPNLHVKSEHRRIITEYSPAVRENCSRQCIFFSKGNYAQKIQDAQVTKSLGTRYVASGMWGLPSLFK